MIDRDLMIQDLSPLGTVIYCDWNSDWSWVVVMENVSNQLSVDGVVNSHLNTTFISSIPSTLEGGVYKIQYDNFPI